MYRHIMAACFNTPLGFIPSALPKVMVGPYGYLARRIPGIPVCVFNGELREVQTDSYLLGNGLRGYHPSLMRFSGPDRCSPFAHGGINAYAYCSADPTNAIDPSGQSWVSKLGRLFRWELPPKVKGSVETNVLEQAYASFDNLNWRQRMVTSRVRSAKTLEEYVKLDTQKEAFLTDIGVFSEADRRLFERRSLEWRRSEELRETARAAGKRRIKAQRSQKRDDPVQEWHRRQLFKHLPEAGVLD